jgi:CRISPR/Cas system-associated exonuclease Cas4 (RecB family)
MSVVLNASMLKKIKEFIIRRKSDDITPSEAEKIQRAWVAINQAEVKKKYTPVYQTLAVGLESEEKQVVEASACYMAEIAVNKPQYTETILKIFQDKTLEVGINPEIREYLKRMIQNILNKTIIN